jgi:pimeloyl-[acyl-carrier protein] methyl ester esterase
LKGTNLKLPILVLLPGLDGTGKLLRAICEALAGRIYTQVIAYPTDQPLGYAELVQFVTDRLPSRPFVLLGESFSGPIAIRLAAKPPAALKGLILCGTFGKNPYPWLGWARAAASWVPIKSLPRWLRAPLMWGARSPQRAPRQVDRAIAAVDARVLRRRVAELLRADEREHLARITLPTLILSGRRDRVLSTAATRWLVQGLPHAHHVEIDGPHLLLQACPQECAAQIAAFMPRPSATDA